MIRIIKTFIAITILTLLGCNDPIFTDITSSNLRIIIKGTLENEDIPAWTLFSQSINGSSLQDDSVVELTSSSDDSHPTKLMLDIAQIKMNGDEISNYRNVITAGLNDTEPFFNGTGIELDCDDPKNGKTYDTVQVYIRKMAFDNSKTYIPSSGGYTYLEDTEFVFHEEDTYGFDFNQLQVISYVDSLKDNAGELLSTFPLAVSIPGGFKYDKDADETVLEIRLAIKDLIKKYEYSYYDDGEFRLVHYYGMSDWLRDIYEGEVYTGKNLHGTARAYVAGNTGTVNITATAGNYVIMIPADDPITDYTADTSVVKPVLGSSTYKGYFPTEPSDPGDYIEPKIDYYLAYEKYKYDFNIAETNCPDLETYATAWDTYDDGVSGFKIAPFVAYSASTSFSFSNVAPGTYNVYQCTRPSYGELFVDGVFTQVGTTITVTAGSTVSVP